MSPGRRTATLPGRPVQAAALLASLLMVAVVAALGARFGPGEWYVELAKPAWTPPGRLFGPVWTLLYLTMAVAAWLVWRQRSGLVGRERDAADAALTAYAIQLLLNAAWSWLFFGRHLIGLALVDIGLLWLAILATTVLFWRVRRIAGLLLVPYLGWVAFASALNLRLWQLNR